LLIFLGGVHGVGKSTMCTDLTGRLGLTVVSASAVIRAERQQPSADCRTAVQDVDGNQGLLVRGVRRLLDGVSERFLLDGHYALRTLTGDIEEISANVFKAIGVKGFVCLVDAPEAIAQRLAARDGEVHDVNAISELQSAELRSAESVSRALRLDLKVVHAFDGRAFEECICLLLDGSGEGLKKP
jgi:adenylate kinase